MRRPITQVDRDSVPRYIEKICVDCKLLKPCKWNSCFTSSGKPEYKTTCDKCNNTRERARNKKNRKRLTESALARKHKFKLELVMLAGGKCIECGYDKCLRALTFHHKDSREKEFTISQAMNRYSKEVILRELEKCDLLCMNCHMEIEEKIDKNADPYQWEYCH